MTWVSSETLVLCQRSYFFSCDANRHGH